MACLHSALATYGAGSLALVANNSSGKALASAGMRVSVGDRLFLDCDSGHPAAAPNAIGLKCGSWRALASRYPAILDVSSLRSDQEEVRFLLSPPR